MGFVNYARNGDTVEIIIRDSHGGKIESHSCSAKDKKRYSHILNYLKDKYGFEPEISIEESVNSMEDARKESLNWLGVSK